MRLYEAEQLIEGGGATGLSPILQKDVMPTIKKVAQYLGIPMDEIHLVGSTGKKARSGDIDIAVDATYYKPQDTHKRMMAIVGDQGSYNKGFNIGSYKFPIKGDPQNGYVQVDIMFVENPEWAKFFIAAQEASRYKNAVRNALLGAVASSLDEPGIDWTLHSKSGQLIARAGRVLKMDKGLMTKYSYLPLLPSGNYRKEPKIVSQEQFQKLFPKARFTNIATSNPTEIVQMLFGDDVKPTDVSTAEKILKLIKLRFTPDKQQKIFKRASELAKDLVKKGVDIPSEITPVYEGINLKQVIEMSQQQLQDAEYIIEWLFKDLQLDIIWSAHFKQRIEGREKDVRTDELISAFKKLKEKYGAQLIAAKNTREEFVGILKDLSTDLNIPFAIDFDKEKPPNHKYHLRGITIVRKDPKRFRANISGGIELRVESTEKQQGELLRNFLYTLKQKRKE